jgi:hypothetical protein
MKNKLFPFLLVLVFLLNACSPSQQAIQTAIAETQEANPTSTLTPVPPTETPTKTPTETPTITPSPTLDLLVLQMNLKDFLLQKSDLPQGYSLRNQSSGLVTNKDVNYIGTDYVEETGRIDGWGVYYSNESQSVSVSDMINLFETSAGAQLAIKKYYVDYNTQYNFIEEINPPEIGDVTRSFYHRSTPVSGKYDPDYYLEIYFSYRNILHIVSVDGGSDKIDADLVRSIARLLLAKLQASPLINP